MKKSICFILVVIMLHMLVFTQAETIDIDYSQLSDEMLFRIIESAEDELSKRNIHSDDKYMCVVNDHGVEIYFLGTYTVKQYSETYIFIDYIALNNNDFKVSFQVPSDRKFNGWSQIDYTGLYNLDAKSKATNTIGFSMSDAMITEASELNELTFTIECVDYDEWKTFCTTKVKLVFIDTSFVVVGQ